MADYDVNVNLSAKVSDFTRSMGIAGKAVKTLGATIQSDLGRIPAVKQVTTDIATMAAAARQAQAVVTGFGASSASAMRGMASSVSASLNQVKASIQGSALVTKSQAGKSSLLASASASVAGAKANAAQVATVMSGAAARVGVAGAKVGASIAQMGTTAAAGVSRMATSVGSGVAAAHSRLVTLIPSIGAAEAAFGSFGGVAKAAMGTAVAATQAGAVTIGRSLAATGAAIKASAVTMGDRMTAFGAHLWDMRIPVQEFGKRLRGDLAIARQSISDFMSLDEDDLSNAALRWGSRRAMINGLASDFTKFGIAGVAALGAVGYAAIQWESSMAGVSKAAELNAVQTARLSEELLQLSLTAPETAENIALVAENAGQLGVPTAAITDFTEVMIAMGSATNLSSEQAADGIARLMNIMGEGSNEIYNFVGNIGSVIVKLGNTSAATEKEIVNMAHRIGAAAVSIGISTADVLAFATAIAELGVRSEAGGTAISRTFRVLNTAVLGAGEDLEIIGKAAGFTADMVGGKLSTAADQFAKAWGTNAAYATTLFIEGLNDIQTSGGNAAETLRSLGIRGERQLAVIMGLVAANGSLRIALDRANTEWEVNSALMEEAEKRYNTTASKIAIARNALNKFAIDAGAVVLPVIADIATAFARWLKAMDGLPAGLKTTALAMVGVSASVALGIATIAKLAVVIKELQALVAVGGFASKLGPALAGVARFGIVGVAAAAALTLLVGSMAALQAMQPKVTATAKETREAIAKLGETGDLTNLTAAYEKALGAAQKLRAEAVTPYDMPKGNASRNTGYGVDIQQIAVAKKEVDVLTRSFELLKRGLDDPAWAAFSGDFKNVEETTRNVGKSLASLAGLGKGEAATKAFASIWEGMRKAGLEAKDAIKYMPEYADQIKSLLVQAGIYNAETVNEIDDLELLSVMTGNVTGKMRVWEAQTGRNAASLYQLGQATLTEEDRIESLTSAIMGAVSQYTNMKVTQDGVRSSTRDLQGLLDKSGYKGQWDKQTKKAEELHGATDQLVTSYQKLIEVQLAEDDGGRKAAQTAIRMKDSLEKLAIQMTGSKDRAQELIDKFNIWPGDLVTTMYVKDEAAAAKLKTIKEAINTLPAQAGLKIAGALNGEGGIDSAYRELSRQMAQGAKGAGESLKKALAADVKGQLGDAAKSSIQGEIEKTKKTLATLKMNRIYAPNAETRSDLDKLIKEAEGKLKGLRAKINIEGDLSGADIKRAEKALAGLTESGKLKIKLFDKNISPEQATAYREMIDKYNSLATLTARLTMDGTSEREKGRLRAEIDKLLTEVNPEVKPKIKADKRSLKDYLDDLEKGMSKTDAIVKFDTSISEGSAELTRLQLTEIANGQGNGWLAKFYAETDPKKRQALIADLISIANNSGANYVVPFVPNVNTEAIGKQLKEYLSNPGAATDATLSAIIEPQMKQIKKADLQKQFDSQSPEFKANYFLEPDPGAKAAMLASMEGLSKDTKINFVPVVPEGEIAKAIAAATAGSAPTVPIAPEINVTPESLERAKSSISSSMTGVPVTVAINADVTAAKAAVAGIGAGASITVTADGGSISTAAAAIQGVADTQRTAKITAEAAGLSAASKKIDKVANKTRTAEIVVKTRIQSSSGVVTIGPDSVTVRVSGSKAYGGLVEALAPLIGKFGTGGQIKGYSPHMRADNILTRLTAGEYVHQVPAVQYYGADVMQALNEMRIPRSLFTGHAYGGPAVPPRSLPGYAYGGSPSRAPAATHSAVNEYKFGDITVDASSFEGVKGVIDFVDMLRRKHRQAGIRR